jgi:hypothetical protein
MALGLIFLAVVASLGERQAVSGSRQPGPIADQRSTR